MLFPISRGIKAAANLRLTKLFFMNCSIFPFRDTLACQMLEMKVRLTYLDSLLQFTMVIFYLFLTNIGPLEARAVENAALTKINIQNHQIGPIDAKALALVLQARIGSKLVHARQQRCRRPRRNDLGLRAAPRHGPHAPGLLRQRRD